MYCILIRANLQKQIKSGVLARRDAGLPPGVWLEPEQLAATVLTSGWLLAPAGRYFEWLGTPTTPDELIPAALAAVDTGATWVKFIADFPGADGNWFTAPPTYAPDLVSKLVREVHAAGARVLAHVSGPVVADLVRAGVDSIEHGTALTAETVRTMADRGIAWTPTLWTITQHIEPLAAQPNPVGSYLRQELARLRQTLTCAVDLGLPLLMGSDEAPHGTFVNELHKLHEYGLPAADLLAAASVKARSYLRLPGMKVGGVAEFTLYDGDPRRDLTVLQQPTVVYTSGSVTDADRR